MNHRAAFGLILALLVLAPVASAGVSLGRGTRLVNGDDTIVIALDGFQPTLAFDATGAPILDGIALDLRDSAGARTWNLTEWTPSLIRLEGPSASTATFRVAGLTGTWRVLGVATEPVITTSGGPWPVTDTITLAPYAPTAAATASEEGATGEDEEYTPIRGIAALDSNSGPAFPPALVVLVGAGALFAILGGGRRTRRRGAGLVLLILVIVLALNFNAIKEILT